MPLTGVGLSIALLIGTILSTFASSHPDGLERVAADLGFEHHAHTHWQMPGSQWLADYNIKQVPKPLGRPLAGGIGVLATFGTMWGLGQLLKVSSEKSSR